MHSSSVIIISCFFFSSRRRHTRWPRDWSSDVCSSDLSLNGKYAQTRTTWQLKTCYHALKKLWPSAHVIRRHAWRSEERRVGKEGRSGRSPEQHRRKETEIEVNVV